MVDGQFVSFVFELVLFVRVVLLILFLIISFTGLFLKDVSI